MQRAFITLRPSWAEVITHWLPLQDSASCVNVLSSSWDSFFTISYYNGMHTDDLANKQISTCIYNYQPLYNI